MRHIFTALVAAIEAAMIALAGIAAIAVPVLLVGLVTFSLQVDLMTLAEVVAGVWVLAHAGHLRLSLDESDALAMGIGAEPLAFTVTLAPLLIAILTATLAWRMGSRFATNFQTGAAALTGASLGFIAASFLVILLAGDFVDSPHWPLALLASLWCIVPAWVGLLVQHADLVSTAWFKLKVQLEQSGAPKLGWGFETYVPRVLRMVGALLAALIGLGALAVALALGWSFVDVVSFTQSLQLDVIGSFVFFLGQLAFLPVFIVWAIAWLGGNGFAIGEGSSITPFETLVGPLPGVPIFAALPEGSSTWGFLAILTVVCAGISVGTLLGGLPEYRNPAFWRITISACVAVMLTGLAVAGAFGLAQGAMGPGRLMITGPEVWVGAGFVAAELAIGVLAGLALRRTVSTNQVTVPEYVAPEYVELVSAPAPPVRALPRSSNASDETVPLDDIVGDAIDIDADDEQVTTDTQPTAVIGDIAGESRIADPVDEDTQPWFRRAASPRKRSQPRKPQAPSFTEAELIEEFSWETRPDDERTER